MSGGLNAILKSIQSEMDVDLDEEEDVDGDDAAALEARIARRDEEAAERQAEVDERKQFQGDLAGALQALTQEVARLAAGLASLQKFVAGNASHAGGQIASLERSVVSMEMMMAAPKEIIRNDDGRPVGVQVKKGPL